MDKAIQTSKWSFRKIALIVLGVIFTAFMIYSFAFRDSQSKIKIELGQHTVSTVSFGPFQESVPVDGVIVPIKSILLDAIEGGRVEEIFVENGAILQEDQSIIRLSNTNLQLDLMNRETLVFDLINNIENTRLTMEQNRINLLNQLADTEYQLEDVKREYHSNKELLAEQAISQNQYEASKNQYNYLQRRRNLTLQNLRQDSVSMNARIKQMEKALNQANQNLSLMKRKLDNLVIKSPVRGQLSGFQTEIGETKVTGENLGQIDVMDGFKIRVSISEHYLPRVTIGQKGSFRFANQQYELVIQRIYPEVVGGQFTVDMYFTGDVPEDIRRGQNVQISLGLSAETEGLRIKRGAFYQQTGGKWIFVIEGGKAIRREIEIGRQNSKFYEVLGGLEEGEEVLVSSYQTFKDFDELIFRE